MAQEVRLIFTFVFLVTIINDFSNCCQDSVKSEGCRIVAGGTGQLECLCGMGCKREFPFHSRTDCETHLQDGDGTADMCLKQPCQNKGVCVQVKYGGYRCECTGTGFYGRNCEQACPARFRSALGLVTDVDSKDDFPLECLLI